MAVLRLRSLPSVSSLLLVLRALAATVPATATTRSVPRSVLAWTPPHGHQLARSSQTEFSLLELPSSADCLGASARSRSRSQRIQQTSFNNYENLQSSRVQRTGFHRHFAAQGTDNQERSTTPDSSSRSGLDPVDGVLRWIASDVGSITLGSIGLLALLLTQVLGGPSSDLSLEATQAATRSNLLAAFACLAVLVNGIAKLDVRSATAESVELRGVSVADPVMGPSCASSTLGSQSSWFLQSVLAATPASTAVLLEYSHDDDDRSATPHWNVACAMGILPSASASELLVPSPRDAPILNRARSAGRDETYLPTLQALPGRTEFLGYVPSNTQAILIVPVVSHPSAPTKSTEPSRVLMVLGSNRAKSFTPRDIVWCQSLAARLGQLLERTP